jgi:hypothetical protein
MLIYIDRNHRHGNMQTSVQVVTTIICTFYMQQKIKLFYLYVTNWIHLNKFGHLFTCMVMWYLWTKFVIIISMIIIIHYDTPQSSLMDSL